jgi:hypothetical protein
MDWLAIFLLYCAFLFVFLVRKRKKKKERRRNKQRIKYNDKPNRETETEAHESNQVFTEIRKQQQVCLDERLGMHDEQSWEHKSFPADDLLVRLYLTTVLEPGMSRA